MPETFRARLVSARTLAPAVRELTFEREGAPLVFEPGQWLTLLLRDAEGDAPALKRSYSIASPPDGSGRFELAVTHVTGGPGSSILHQLSPGESLTATGPQGFFTRDAADPAPSLFIGTGTGMTPLRSMIKAALARDSEAPLWLLHGVRTEADLLYRDELEALSAKHRNLRVMTTLSRPHDGWQGLRGYVQLHLRELWAELSRQGDAPHLYICGLERMVKAVRDVARKELGVAREQVHSERYD